MSVDAILEAIALAVPIWAIILVGVAVTLDRTATTSALQTLAMALWVQLASARAMRHEDHGKGRERGTSS